MHREFLDEDELMSYLRQQGIDDLAAVKAALSKARAMCR